MTHNQLTKCNDDLRRELGTAPGSSDPLFKWMRAGSFEYLSWEGQMWHSSITGQMEWKGCYDYEKDEKSGLEIPVKRFVKRKMCPHLDDEQWVLAIWLASHGWTEIFQFGKCMYGFTVDLPLGMEPSDAYRGGTINDQVIGTIKASRKKTEAEQNAAFEEKIAKADTSSYANLRDRISNDFTAFLNVPGSHGHHVEFMAGHEPKLITEGETNGDHGSGKPDDPVSVPGQA